MEGAGCFVGTIHSAKGREWDTVVVAAFEDQVIPGRRAAPDVAEERRLAYVAISRARLRLTLTWAAFRSRGWAAGPSRMFPQDLSRFAEEAGINER
jgi:DNA helicase-2/ATP-dependent DNA helicase PcrA